MSIYIYIVGYCVYYSIYSIIVLISDIVLSITVFISTIYLIFIIIDWISYLVGGLNPSETFGSQLGWWNIWKKTKTSKCSKPPTQYRMSDGAPLQKRLSQRMLVDTQTKQEMKTVYLLDGWETLSSSLAPNSIGNLWGIWIPQTLRIAPS